MNYSSYSYVLNKLNLVLGKQKPQVSIKYSKINYTIVYLLYKIGCLNNFVIYTKKIQNVYQKLIYFSIFFYKNSPFFKQIKLISSSSKKHTITYKALKIINQSIGSSILLISTSHGLMTHRQALNVKLGGLLIAVLN